MKIVVIDGASASSRREHDRLTRVVFGCTGHTGIEIKHSLNRWQTARELTRLVASFPYDEKIVFVAKSQGASRFCKWFKKQKPTIGFHRFHVVTIDPHHWFMGMCEIDLPQKFGSFRNLIQDQYHPQGAEVHGQVNELVDGVDHWNIIHAPEVRRAIANAIERAV